MHMSYSQEMSYTEVTLSASQELQELVCHIAASFPRKDCFKHVDVWSLQDTDTYILATKCYMNHRFLNSLTSMHIPASLM
jgi:hypothetical protein